MLFVSGWLDVSKSLCWLFNLGGAKLGEDILENN